MPDPAERFIAAATAPLGDNAELQAMAAQELRGVLSSATERPGSDSLEVAAENLETEWPWKRWKAVLYGLTALVVIVTAIPLARDYIRYRLATYAVFAMGDPISVSLPGLPFGGHAESRVPRLLGAFSPSERLLLFGDLSKAEPDRSKVLWDNEPDNPAFFADYVRACARHDSLPSAFLETSDLLDAENAWFRHLAAGDAARFAVEKIRATYHHRKKTPNAPRYRIKDRVRYAEAIRLLEESARLSKLESYEQDLFLRRLEILPAGDDILGRKLTQSYLTMEPRESSWIYPAIADAVAARAEELASAGDPEAFVALIQAWESFIRRSIESAVVSPHGVEAPLIRFCPSGENIARSAEALGLKELSSRFDRLVRTLESRRMSHSARWAESKALRSKGGFSAFEILDGRANLADPPPLDESALEPGRRAEHAMRSRIGAAMVGVFMLLLTLLTAATRFPRGLQVRRLSHALLRVLRPADYRWILVGGVVLPVLVHLLLEQVCAAVGFQSWDAAILRHFTLAGALLTLPTLIAARRLGSRLGCLGWDQPRRYSMGLIAAGLLSAGIAGSMDFEAAQVLGWMVVMTVPLVGFLILPFGALIAPRVSAVRWQVYCRAVLPGQVLAVLLMGLLVPLHHARERRWTGLNTLTRIEAGVPGMNRYEHEIARRMRLELLEIFDAKPGNASFPEASN